MSDFDKNKISIYINKWIPLLEKILVSDSLLERCKEYNAYIVSNEADILLKELNFHEFLLEAYDSSIVIPDYSLFSEGREEMIDNPTSEFLYSISTIDVIRSIAYHYRRDHFIEGSLINESFTNGSLLKLFQALKDRLI